LSSSDRVKNEQGQWEDKDQTWHTVKAWGKTADYALATLKKGQEVIVLGTLYEDNWTDKDGNKKTSYEIKADNIGATVFTLAKNTANSISTPQDDPWK
jgi:single-strand DNA-binding protein